MEPDKRFVGQPMPFWACVRTISQKVGYTRRGTGQILVPSMAEMEAAFKDLGLDGEIIRNKDGNREPTELAERLQAYFQYRADILNDYVRPRLMDAAQAKKEFDRLRAELKPTCPLPMNKQKGEKRAPAFLTGMVNMIVEANASGLPCDYDPRELTTFTRDGVPVRTLARRVDGAFPSPVNPLAVWEIKEYYYTTTFGSRVADGVYESLLDGMELEELRNEEGIDCKHFLMVDAYFTWWDCGRSYLCRMIDMLHMGYVDEVLFGYEVVERLPGIIQRLVESHREKLAEPKAELA